MSSLLRLCRTAILPGGTEGILLLPTEVGLRSVATLEPPPFPRANTTSVSTSPRLAFCVRPVRGRKCGAHVFPVWRASPVVPAFSFIPAIAPPIPRAASSSVVPPASSVLPTVSTPSTASCRPSTPFPHPSASEWSRAATFHSLLSHHADALVSACFCLGLNVCYMPRKKVTFVCLNALFFIHLQCKLFRTLPVLHQLLLRAALYRQTLSLHPFVSP